MLTAVFSVASLALTSISIIMAAIVMSLASRGAVRKHVPSWLSTVSVHVSISDACVHIKAFTHLKLLHKPLFNV